MLDWNMYNLGMAEIAYLSFIYLFILKLPEHIKLFTFNHSEF